MIFVYDIDMYLFQVLPLLPWTSKFSKKIIIRYFDHHFPLTSHIRGNLLSAKMTLLRTSTDIPHVGRQKDKFGLKWPKHYRWAWPRMHYLQTSFIYIFYKYWVAYVTICIVTRVPYVIICIETHVHLCMGFPSVFAFHTPRSHGRNIQATRCVLRGKSRVKAVTLFLTPPFRLNS